MNLNFVSGICFGGLLVYAINSIWSPIVRKKTPKEAIAKSNEPTTPIRQESPATYSWFAVPGERLELGTSGFYIQLIDKDDEPPYLGYSPEGFLYGRSRELNAMKDYLEARASERAEFELKQKPWTAPKLKGTRHE